MSERPDPQYMTVAQIRRELLIRDLDELIRLNTKEASTIPKNIIELLMSGDAGLPHEVITWIVEHCKHEWTSVTVAGVHLRVCDVCGGGDTP